MITPWEIYWVLQLDSIDNVFVALAAISGIGLIVTGVAWFMANDDVLGSEAFASALKPFVTRVLPSILLVALIVGAFLPSTKTAAAMIVVPKIFNSPTIQHEAGDLYNLAKQALRDAIAPAQKKD